MFRDHLVLGERGYYRIKLPVRDGAGGNQHTTKPWGGSG